jgi:beta-galactosidase
MNGETGIAEADRKAAEQAYRQLNDSPVQRRLREQREWFIGAVYWRPGDYEPGELVRELRRMRELGFNIVRFHTADPEQTAPGAYDFTRTDAWLDAAAEAGIGVILHAGGGKPTEEACAAQGLTRDYYDRCHLDEPGPLAVLEQRLGPICDRYRRHGSLYAWGMLGEPNPVLGSLDNDYDRARFADWLRRRYDSLEALDAAWNIYPEAGRLLVESFEEAWRLAEPNVAGKISGAHRAKYVYGAQRDKLRYLADKDIARTRAVVETVRRHDPDHPLTVGSHQLFYNPAQLAWDVAERARAADLHFTSIHLSWHFEQVAGEVDRPVYMQARLTRDAFKGGWTSAYETTGGPVQYSGGYGVGMSAGLMRRMALSYLAAGNVNIAFWTWNHRPGCWEAGEYGLASLSGRLTPWAQEAGKVARGMERWHEELWEATAEPRVGLVQSWDTEAILTLEPQRHDLRDGPTEHSRGTATQAQRASIGAARAMVNAHVPFEYVTTAELSEGIAAVYPTLLVPHARAVSAELVDVLRDYVEKGGRVIVDVQFAFVDPWGKMHPAGEGGSQERLLGAWVDNVHDARTRPMRLGDIEVEGFFADVEVTRARVLARFADGGPAVTEHRLGRGSAVLVGFDAARMCHRPGRSAVERLLAELARGDAPPSWTCDAPLAFRLSAPGADHYFLLNDGPSRPALLRAFDRRYAAGEDVIEQKPIDVSGTLAVQLPERSGVWARFERAD